MLSAYMVLSFYNFHERSEFTSTLTSTLTSETSVIIYIALQRYEEFPKNLANRLSFFACRPTFPQLPPAFSAFSACVPMLSPTAFRCSSRNEKTFRPAFPDNQFCPSRQREAHDVAHCFTLGTFCFTIGNSLFQRVKQVVSLFYVNVKQIDYQITTCVNRVFLSSYF